MSEAPRDGRWIIAIKRDSREPCRVRWAYPLGWWSDNLVMIDDEFHGWIEDIEPPEERKLHIGPFTFERAKNGSVIFHRGLAELFRPITPEEAERLHAWLGQWHGKDDE